MAVQQEKVYVAVGKDVQQGLGALGWALRNWSSQSVSFVILHVSVSKDLIYTPSSKLPTCSVNDEKLEQERVDKILGKYMAFCSKVKAEVLKIERCDESIHKTIIELISSLQIRKLAMGITFTKSLSRKLKDDMTSIPYYVHKHKPEFCDVFMVCGGKLVFLREEKDDGDYFEDEQGMMVADFRKKSKEKCSLKGWLGRMLSDSSLCCSDHGSSRRLASPSNTVMPEVTCRWEDHWEEIENHIQCLESSNPEELEDQPKLEPTVSDMHPIIIKGIEDLKTKVEEAQKMVEEKKIEANTDVERRRKAEWFTFLCNQRAEEIEASLKEEMAKQAELKEELDAVKDQITKVSDEVVEKGSMLNSMLGVNKDLMIKLELSSWEKTRIETQLEKAVCVKTEMAREVEEIRRHRDMLLQKIKYYKETEVLAAADGSRCVFREFTADEVRDATDDFSKCMAIQAAGEEDMLYKGVIGHTTVAIQFKTEFLLQFPDEFKAQVGWLCKIRHPNVVAVIGACVERRCIVFEYMDGGTLHDALFSSCPLRTESVLLPWHARIRIAAEIASALGFLHSSRPHPAAHGRLCPSRVLLDCHLSAKIAGLRPSSAAAPAPTADVAALGALILQLLTGQEAVAGEEVRRAIGRGNLMGILDRTAGDWPLDLATDFAGVGLRCAETPEKDGDGEEGEWTAGMVRELEDLKKRADERMKVRMGEGHHKKEQENAPNVFICPIFQEVMKQPHVAADGFSYELEAIKEWLDNGHETSPMTNLKLNHKHLMPNHTLQSLIYNWQQTNQSV